MGGSSVSVYGTCWEFVIVEKGGVGGDICSPNSRAATGGRRRERTNMVGNGKGLIRLVSREKSNGKISTERTVS